MGLMRKRMRVTSAKEKWAGRQSGDIPFLKDYA
ncbi:hypothetical protein SRIMHP_23720 [Streptomyces rimosus subsp. rimosus]|nr:hypothetical protein SRIMHP_23720 [Streptomyces rimosus subsp. rimosus]